MQVETRIPKSICGLSERYLPAGIAAIGRAADP
jgi:hypothetical protein